MGQFLFALFGTSQFDEPLKGERALRKWINSGTPMHADDFRRVLAQAFIHEWLSLPQAYSLWESVLEFEAASSGLRHLLKRIRIGHSATLNEGTAQTLALQIEKEIALSRDRLSERAKANMMRPTSLEGIAKKALPGSPPKDEEL
ncbi:hypothetical protein [Cupriavidus necator]|uniref:hypothetical protein n=1 Tax=Cupriavidus necator TaxID=106590 RepID=UPI003F73EF89